MKLNPPWYSSYEKNNYGDFFYSLMRVHRPRKVVELGTKAGYSTYHMARGLKENGNGTLDCYDLWETYKFNSVPKAIAEKNLRKFKDIVRFELRDAVGVDKLYKEIDPVRGRGTLRALATSNGVDILHVDVGNEGEILGNIIPHWIDKIGQFIIIEGGSAERDKIRWMIKYKKAPIAGWLKDFANRRDDIEYFTIEPFPSVTIIRKI